LRESRDLAIGEVRGPEGNGVCDPLPKCEVEPGIVAAMIRVGRDPPAYVDILLQHIFVERSAPAHRVEIAAAEVLATGVVDSMPDE
jgi:hypothetical protein